MPLVRLMAVIGHRVYGEVVLVKDNINDLICFSILQHK